MTERLLTTREAAEYLHIRSETLLAWDRSGKLRGYRISSNALRWDPDEIEAFLRAHAGGWAGSARRSVTRA